MKLYVVWFKPFSIESPKRLLDTVRIMSLHRKWLFYLAGLVCITLAIAGGILAVLRKRWRWSLAGSIAAALSLIILGIPAVVLIAISKDEFT